MWAYRYLIAALFASLALQTPVQGQECDPNYYERVPLYLVQPYTAEYRERYEWPDHQESATEDTRVEAQDSQGRHLDRWTSADGSGRSQVRDPVADQTITWNTRSTKAKVVEYPTPVAGRFSCWRTPDPEEGIGPDEPPPGLYESSCAPAGQGQTMPCRDACEAKRQAKALPALKNGFPPCGSDEPGTEDLGTKVIHGVAAHGCRTTKTLPSRKCVAGRCPAPSPYGRKRFQEIWSDEYGLTLRKIEASGDGDKCYEELLSLNREEPNLATFRPPDGYEIVTIEMDEVPCEPRTQ
jgi:hypothetical protein